MRPYLAEKGEKLAPKLPKSKDLASQRAQMDSNGKKWKTLVKIFEIAEIQEITPENG